MGSDSREEVWLPLGRTKRQPPAGLAGLIRLYTRDSELEPVARLDTRRRRWMLCDSRGRELAELVEDRVNAHTLGEQTSAVSWREVEVEAAEHAQLELLDSIERELSRHGAHRSACASKLARVLADRLAPAPDQGDTTHATDRTAEVAQQVQLMGDRRLLHSHRLGQLGDRLRALPGSVRIRGRPEVVMVLQRGRHIRGGLGIEPGGRSVPALHPVSLVRESARGADRRSQTWLGQFTSVQVMRSCASRAIPALSQTIS